jgi:hypothetical protein
LPFIVSDFSLPCRLSLAAALESRLRDAFFRCCTSISLVSLVMFFFLCTLLGYAPGVSPCPTPPLAYISGFATFLPRLPFRLTTSLSLSSLSVGRSPIGLCASLRSSSALAGLLIACLFEMNGIGAFLGAFLLFWRRLTGARGMLRDSTEAHSQDRSVVDGYTSSSKDCDTVERLEMGTWAKEDQTRLRLAAVEGRGAFKLC